jgi:hypothetical protein
MISFVWRIIVIECFSIGGLPLEEASENCFLSIKVLLWCCGFIYCVVPLLFSAVFMFLCYYNRSGTSQVVSEHFPWQKIVGYFFSRVEMYSDVLEIQRYVVQCINPRSGKHTLRNYMWYLSAHYWPPL